MRWTCIVSRRVARKAVDRNCIKRWCREAARTYAKHTGDTAALVFRAKKEAFHAEFADVKNDVRTLVEKYGSTVYNNPQ